MQNINLYQRERRRGGGPRQRHLILGLGLVALLLLSHGGWQGWRLHVAGQAALAAEGRAAQAEAVLAPIKANFHEPTADPRLPVRLAERESENRELQRLAEYLRDLDSERRGGFSSLLQALADRHPPSGLWLTRISLQAGGSELVLQGRSQNQELLPLYLQSLGQSPVFSGREFARFDLQRDPDDLLRFQLASKAGEEGNNE